MHAARSNRADLLRDATRGTSSRRLGKLMGRLIGVEMAVSFVLLIAAGLFIRSVVNLRAFPFTFAPEGVYTAHVRMPDGYDEAAERAALTAELERALTSIPGATSATLATAVPGIQAPRVEVAVEGVHDIADTDLASVRAVEVSPGFFDVFSAPLLQGRGFNSGDGAEGLPVVVVNQAFEQKYLPAGAVDHRISLRGEAGKAEWLTIVGVAPDLLPSGLERDIPEAIYRPVAQASPLGFYAAVRTSGPPSALAAPIREAVAKVDPDLATFFMRPLDEAIDAANSGWAWMSALFVVAGGLALFLAAIGLYGVMAFWVAQRTREIGVRMALGGGRRTIVKLVLRQAMVRVAVGVGAGLLVAAPIGWLLRTILLDVRPFDPFVFLLVPAVLLAAGWLGCVIPALRATRVDPQVALASE
jgi:predicted permease